MGKDSRSKSLSSTANTAGSAYNSLQSAPTAFENEFIPQSQTMWNNYMSGVGQQNQDYTDIMGGYRNFANSMGGPRSYGAQQVSVNRPAELTEGYGYLRGAMPGYQDFANTGGYSDTDIQELRARGTSPIRSAYSNTMMELNRSRALGGAGGSPNYIAALSRAQRELPGQLADATTGVNASLADAIRQGKLSGLAGMTGIGSEMSGLAGAESGRQLQAGIANQGADLTAQGLTQQGLRDWQGMQLGALQGQTGLYGTTPAMAATFGNQALNAYGQRAGMEQARNQQGLGLLGTQIQGYSAMTPKKSVLDTILGGVGSIVPYLGGFGGGGMDAGNEAVNQLPQGTDYWNQMPSLYGGG